MKSLSANMIEAPEQIKTRIKKLNIGIAIVSIIILISFVMIVVNFF